MELIALHQIATREKSGGPRIVIPVGRQFDTIDYPMISDTEWQEMMSGSPQIVRTPDDSAFAIRTPEVIVHPLVADDERIAAAYEAARAIAEEEDEPAMVPRRRVRRAPVDDDDEV